MNIITLWQGFRYEVAGLIFIAYFLIDAMYAYYTLAVVGKKPFIAASVGATMHLLIAFGILSYVQNYLYLIPIVLGSWLGTFYVVNRDSKG